MPPSKWKSEKPQYLLWQEMQDEVCRVYTDEMPERVPLSRQKEFKPVRNMVVKEALALSRQEFTFDDEGMDDEPEDTDEPSLAWEAITDPKKKQTRSVYEQAERYWNMVHGNTPEEVMQDAEGLQIMRVLGRNMAWFLRLKEAGEKVGISLPEQEETRIATNFIR